MVISFSCEKARQFLLAQGWVYTWRKNRRTMLGKDWANKHRGGKKIADVYIVEVGCFKIKDLGRYVAESGFDGLDEWLENIQKLHKSGGTGITSEWTGWLYLVTIR